MAGSAEVMLEKGVFLQETKGDLDGAVKIYKQIVADAKANRPHAAEAQYRLGVCLLKLKRHQEAIAAFRTLIADFPQQGKLVAKARREIARSRKAITGEELAKIVEQAVLTISTCAETDPRVKPALESLDGLDEPATVKAIAKFLDSEKATVRRSAIYILWKGGFKSIESVVPALLKLCEHESELTRGTAALALGGRKVKSSFKPLCDMAISDTGPFARRCAAYGLGLLGDPRAKPTLEKALKDKEVFVRNNAEAALTMLQMAEAEQDELPPAVMEHIIGAHLAAYHNARPTPTNTHIYVVDESFVMGYGGLITVRNATDKPIAGEVGVGNFSYPDLIVYDETGRTKNFRLRQPGFGAGGKYRLFWTPPRPIKPGDVQVVGWRRKRTTVLPKVAGGRELVMKNRYGAEVVESFFLVLPAGTEIASESLQRTSRTRIGQYDVCLYQRKVPAGKTNIVEVVLRPSRGIPETAEPKPTLKLDPAPWADGEEAYMILKAPTGADLGVAVSETVADTRNGKKVWRMRSRVLVASMPVFSECIADAESFLPIVSRIEADVIGRLQAYHTPTSIVWKAEKAGQKTSRTVGLQEVTYDEEQLVHLVRRLPLKDGYMATFNTFSGQHGLVNPCRVKVVGREKITVPAGTYDCYKLTIDTTVGAMTLQFKCWLTADRHRYVVKFDAHAMVMELKAIKIKPKSPAKPAKGTDPQDLVRVALPAGWFCHGGNADSGAPALFLLPPEMKTYAMLNSREHGGNLPPVEKVAQIDIGQLEKALAGYTVRQGTWVKQELSGCPAAGYVAEYTQTGRQFVEYRTYIRGEKMVYWFIFRVAKGDFEANRAAYDAIIKSFEVCAPTEAGTSRPESP